MRRKSEGELLLVGSSTGGVPVVTKLLKGLELENKILIICQHIGAGEFTQNLFESFKKACRNLVLVDHDLVLEKGKVYLLAGGSDYQLQKKYNKTYLISAKNEAAKYHPSFDTLVCSSLELEQKSMILILSGLGNDGAQYLKEAKKVGTFVIVQDPSTAVAPFMPQAALQSGQVDEVIPGNELHDYILKRSA